MSTSRGIVLQPDIPICQTDLPLDWYQPEFKPYAEEYLALPDRLPGTVLPWMDRYIEPARAALGPELVLLAHYYMGGEIVKLVERYGGLIADSYQLAREAVLHPEKRIFVESAVHFMAEAIALLAAPHQQVWITNPKSGCTMEMMAKEFMIAPLFAKLEARYGDDVMVIAYMNTSGRVKALAGRTGGAVCTSSNAGAIMRWARAQGKKIFFVPDQHLGRNVAAQVGLAPEKTHRCVPAGHEGGDLSRRRARDARPRRADPVGLASAACTRSSSRRTSRTGSARGYSVVVHPETPREVVALADGSGSTS